MIVPMTKLSILVFYREKKEFLKSLQEIGIMHIEENRDGEQAENVSEAYKKAIKQSHSCEAMIQVLTEMYKDQELDSIPLKGKQLPEGKIQEIIKEFETAEQKKESLLQDLSDVKKDIKQIKPWGEFDPEIIAALELKGVNLRFFETSEKKFKTLKIGDICLEVVSILKNRVKFLVFEKETKFETDQAEEINLPIKSLQALDEEVKRIQAELDKIDILYEKLTIYIDALEEFKTSSNNTAAYATADSSMVAEMKGKAFSLTGWFPTSREKMVNDFLEDYICYYRLEKPDSYDNVPILLKNNRFTRLFEPITKIYSLPSYREIDPTPYFAPFFVIYFGLCLGDLGYGFMTLFIATFALLKGPPKFRNFYYIGIILGFMTIISGIALNSFFGESVFFLRGNQQYLFRSEFGAMLSFLGSYISVEKLTVFPAMGFAIFLGFVQVLLGIILQCVNRIRQHGFAWGIHPASFFIIICGILFSISYGDKTSGFKGITGIDISTYQLAGLKIGSWLTIPPQEFGIFLIVFGLILMFLFNNPDKKIFLRPLMGLWELYGFATGIVGDILSYLRLFALGLASGLLGNAFNGIAFGFIENSIFPGIIGTVILLVFAHALNFGLAILGAFVHPLRLTFVEFYKNLDFEGGGMGYSPFLKEKL